MASTNLKTRGSGYTPELDDAERASRDEVMALQTRRLAWSLKHAYDNVAHYKKAFDAAGVHPSDFKQLSDLARFPFTVLLKGMLPKFEPMLEPAFLSRQTAVRSMNPIGITQVLPSRMKAGV